MRIISGNLKGKKLLFIRSSKTRPLKDSVKENIFNILIHSKIINVSVERSKILDFYSGIGSFGLECLSRNAKKVTFIENDIKAFSLLSKNLDKLSLKDKAILFNDKIENVIHRLNSSYQIFFFDPPFRDKNFIEYFKTLKERQLYSKNHIVIIHREKKSDEDLKKYLNFISERVYGRSKIIFAKFN